MKLEHIGIAVRNLAQANARFETLFRQQCSEVETVESEKVTTSFFHLGESKVELLAATAPESTIAKFIDQKGEGIHHIAFEVEDIVSEMERLKSEGFRLVNETPKKGADHKWVCFLHPKSTQGVLIELCQTVKEA